MTPITKTCRRCGIVKAEIQFGYLRTRDKFDTLCRECRKSLLPRNKDEQAMVEAAHDSDTRTDKSCRECGERKPLADFSRMRNGFNFRCNDCQAKYLASYHTDPKRIRENKKRLAELTEKTCTRCGETKEISAFTITAKRGVVSSHCRACAAEWHREQRVADPDRASVRDRHKLLRKVGMSVEDFKTALTEQKGRCAICEKHVGRSIHLDHCHKTGKFRGLLCTHCNNGLGRFRDEPDLLRKAAEYLEKSV